jgi:hypothetical protein
VLAKLRRVRRSLASIVKSEGGEGRPSTKFIEGRGSTPATENTNTGFS